MLLLGLKRDLRHNPGGSEEEKKKYKGGVVELVDPLQAYKIAQDLRCDGYLECSAMTGELVAQVREDLGRVVAAVAKRRDGDAGGGWRGAGCVVA